jgi:hypothetical protein
MTRAVSNHQNRSGETPVGFTCGGGAAALGARLARHKKEAGDLLIGIENHFCVQVGLSKLAGDQHHIISHHNIAFCG